MTRPELCKHSGLANSTVSRWVEILRAKPNLIYVESYRRRADRGNWQEVFAAGYMQDDAPRPVPMTAAEYRRRHKVKVNKLKEKEDERKYSSKSTSRLCEPSQCNV
jgi:hypothetical protein